MKKLAALFLILLLCAGWRTGSSPPVFPPLTGFTAGTPFFYNSNYPTQYEGSDTHYSTWGINGTIYMTHDDVPGNLWWNGSNGNSNIAFSSISGFTPSTMTGTGINRMAQWGGSSFFGSDGNTYKVFGLISVRGALYIVTIRQHPDGTCLGVQLIFSGDFGITWTPVPPSTGQAYASPMFAGPFCPAPIQYGEDYTGQTVDNSGTYLYFTWNESSAALAHLFLARVKITDLPALDATKYSYYIGPAGGDGMADSNWSSSNANPTNVAPNATTALQPDGADATIANGAAQYIMGRYLLVATSRATPQGTVIPNSNFIWWEAPHPWGPWTRIGSTHYPGIGLYDAFIIAKSVVGNSGYILTNGNFQNFAAQNGTYTPVLIQFTVHN